MIATSHSKALAELASALGVKNALSMTLHVEANSPVTLTTVHYIDESSLWTLTETIKKFELKEKS